MSNGHQYTNEQLGFLKDNHHISRNALCEAFNAFFRTSLSHSAIKATCLRNGFKTGRTGQLTKGHETWNKGKSGYMGANATSFKKGQRIHNQKPVGWMRITKDGYIEMKVSEPKEFRYLHHIVYESEFGAIPKNHVVIFRDNDSTHVHPDNLALLSRGELAILNHEFNMKDSDIAIKPTVLALAKLKSKISEVRKCV